MLARLAAALRERQVIRGTIETTEGGEGGTIILDENCNVSWTISFCLLLRLVSIKAEN